MEIVKDLLVYLAPIIAGFITSVLIPFLIKRVTMKSLQKKINDVSPTKEMKDIKEKLVSIEKELLELRGKRK